MSWHLHKNPWYFRSMSRHLHKNPRYLRSMSRHSVCSLMASRMESDDTSPVSRTTFSSWFMVMRGRRTASRMGVGSAPWLCSAHSHTAWKMSISCAQKESLRMRSRTDICNVRQKQAYLKWTAGTLCWARFCVVCCRKHTVVRFQTKSLVVFSKFL